MFRVLSYYGMWRGGYAEYLKQPVREIYEDFEWLKATRKAEADAARG